MKSENTFSSPLLKRVDELIRPCHPFLLQEDEIYYLGEYTTGKLSDYSRTNRLIHNYKKGLERKEKSDWPYKEQAIRHVANQFRSSISQTIGLCERFQRATLVPIPPSKSKDSPEYDDRNYRMLTQLVPSGDVRELILQKSSRDPLHKSKVHRDYKDLQKHYIITEIASTTMPKEIWVFDDTFTKGTHFRAIKELLQKQCPGVPIIGFFIARSVRIL